MTSSIGKYSFDNIRCNRATQTYEQGSTKVFKTRAKLAQSALGANVLHDVSASSSSGPSSSTIVTTQHLVATLQPSSCLLLLPDPVTCFASSSYSQTQTFHLPPIISSSGGGSASAIILDWFTSGRMARNEEWAFERYRSCNEIWIGGRRVARDVMLLEQHAPTTFSSSSPTSPEPGLEQQTQRPSATGPVSTLAPLPPRTLRARLAPYSCYATLFLIGSLAAPIITSLSAQFAAIQQMQATKPDKLLWALSPLNIPVSAKADTSLVAEGGNDRQNAGAGGVIVRVMGMETELVREWLKGVLSPLRDSIGADAYQTAFI
jgi:urease accessory protein